MTPIHVLHVDDDAGFRELVSEFLTLENERISAIPARDPTQGRELLATHDVDCIVSDYEMPGQTGMEFLESVREEYEDLPFVLFTGRGSEEIASQAIAAGVTDYLQKSGGRDTYAILANRVVNAVDKYRAEQEVKHAERKLRAITDSAADAIVTVDGESVVQFANPAVEDVFGYTPGELEGESLSLLVPARLWDDHRKALRNYLDTGDRSVSWDAFEVYGRRKDGSEVPLSVSFGEFTLNGEIHFTGIIRDVSERVDLQQQVDEEKRQLHELGEQLEELVWITDPTRKQLLYVNRQYEEVWGKSLQSLFDDPMSFIESVHPDDRDRVEELLTELPVVGYDIEYRIVHPETGTRWVRDHSVPIPDEAGTVERIIGVAEDVTQRKQHEQRIERQLTQLTEFASVLSHDLATPLSTTEGRIALARETGDTTHLEDAAQAVQRIREVTDEVATVMRAGRLVDETGELDFESVLRDVWNGLDTGGASLTVEDTATIRADRSAFKRLIENLFKNAIEHGESPANVRAGILDTGFFVEDDGPGIPDEDHESVFAPGFTTRAGGQGLGLASVRQITQAHDWDVEVRDADGGGTRFEVSRVELVPNSLSQTE